MSNATIHKYIVTLRSGPLLSATTIEAYHLRDAMTMGFDFLAKNQTLYTSVELTVVQLGKEIS